MIQLECFACCSGCGACMATCPVNAISMTPDVDGFLYPKADVEACINCGKCEKVCPFLNGNEVNMGMPAAYAAQTTNETIRRNSSSGGIFTEIALAILQQGGIVFGAAFDESFAVKHICVETEEELYKLRGSKYVQSTTGTTFIAAKKHLDAGRVVLFTGTPCQIAGLSRFLGKEYGNLYTQDVICHGVPSSVVWKKYLSGEEKKYGGRIRDISFRHKKMSWQNFGVMIHSDTCEVFESHTQNPYMNLFLKNYSLRPSCYACSIKNNSSYADITLGDFWGIENVAPDINDGKGTSLVIVHSEKGQELLERTKEQLLVREVSYEAARQYNTPIFRSAYAPENRDAFFEDMRTMEIADLAVKYCVRKKTMRDRFRDTFVWKLIRKIVRGGGTDNSYGMYLVFVREYDFDQK